VSGHGSLQAGVWEIPDPQVYQVAIRLAPKQKSENGRKCGSTLTTISFLCGFSEPVFRRLSLRCMKATFRNWQTHDGDLLVAANQEWHYSKGDQQFGPVSGATLRQLVSSGDVSPGDLIWKEEWPEWKRADSVKGLFPISASKTAPPIRPPSSPESVRAAAEAAAQVSRKLWFLDLSFQQFATPRLIGFVFITALVGLVLTAIGVAFHVLFNFPVLKAAFILVVDVIILGMLAVCLRVFLECCLLGFKMVEHLSHLRHLANDEELSI